MFSMGKAGRERFGAAGSKTGTQAAGEPEETGGRGSVIPRLRLLAGGHPVQGRRMNLRSRAFLTALLLAGLPFLAWARGVAVLENQPYREGPTLTDYERERCRLDLYLPEGEHGYATLVWFHGGSLTAGAKTDAAQLGRRLAAAGIAVAAVNYRLSPRAHFPAYVEDAAAAVAWVRGHVAEHGGDANRVFVGGHSAGGYLTLMVGMDARYLARFGLKLDAIAGLVPVSGQTMTHYTVREERGLPQDVVIADDAAPVHFARESLPPLLLVWASDDLPTRAEENSYLAALIRAAGRTRLTTSVMPHRDHGTIVSDIGAPDDQLVPTIVRFVQTTRR
jgi:acetyl esterase/lipase